MKGSTYIFTIVLVLYFANISQSWAPFECPEGQVHNSCGSQCNATCDNPRPTCQRSCIRRCECPVESPIYKDGECVTYEQCEIEKKPKKWPPLDCPEGQIYNRCGSLCNLTCDDPFPTCRRMCVERCGCPPKKPYYHKGECVEFSKCNEEKNKAENHDEDKDIHEIMCPPTQQFQLCGSRCNRTCDNGGKIISCAKVCVTRCGCPYDRPVWHDNKCIAVKECPKIKEDDTSRSYEKAKVKKPPVPIAALNMMEQALALMRMLKQKPT